MLKKSDSEKYLISEKEFREMETPEKILKMSEGLEAPLSRSEQDVLDDILKKSDIQKTVRPITLGRYLRAAAAVLLLLVGVYTVNTVFSKERIKTAYAEQTQFSLPDGTQVTLNAGSKVTWTERSFTKNRELKLAGEAYFDVKKGSKFKINTKNGVVEILGTQLNVFSRDREFRVSCISGRVKVSSAGNEEIITPGEFTELTAQGLVKNSMDDIGKTISWQQGLFYFEDKPLVSIFETLERQFNVSVKFEGNRDRSITVAFSNHDLEEALDIICTPMGLKYEINNNKVRISELPE